MPERSGYETIKLLRASSIEQIPIIALTANALIRIVRLCIEAGASDYISTDLYRNSFYQLCRKTFVRSHQKMELIIPLIF